MMGKYFLTRFRLKTVHRQVFFFMFKLIHSIVFCKSYTHSEGFFCFHLAAGTFCQDTGQDNAHKNSFDPAAIGLKNYLT